MKCRKCKRDLPRAEFKSRIGRIAPGRHHHHYACRKCRRR